MINTINIQELDNSINKVNITTGGYPINLLQKKNSEITLYVDDKWNKLDQPKVTTLHEYIFRIKQGSMFRLVMDPTEIKVDVDFHSTLASCTDNIQEKVVRINKYLFDNNHREVSQEELIELVSQ